MAGHPTGHTLSETTTHHHLMTTRALTTTTRALTTTLALHGHPSPNHHLMTTRASHDQSSPMLYSSHTRTPHARERERPELWPAPTTGHTLPEPHTTTRALTAMHMHMHMHWHLHMHMHKYSAPVHLQQ